MSFCTVSVSVCFLANPFHICIVCVCVFVCDWVLQRAYRNIFPLLRGAAVLLSRTRSHAGHCICVLCITSCVRLWIVSETIVCFALKGHLNHLPLGCKLRRIQHNMYFSPCAVTWIQPEPTVDVMNHNLDMSIAQIFTSKYNTMSCNCSPSSNRAPSF